MDTAILQALEKIRCPFLDVFFGIFTALGEEMIVAAVIAVIYICFSKRVGEQALVTVLTASCFTAAIKSGLRRLRPYEAGTVDRVNIDNPLVSTADLDADMSFPAGTRRRRAVSFPPSPSAYARRSPSYCARYSCCW